MIKLVINYDMMDKIQFANGNYKLKMYYKMLYKEPIIVLTSIEGVFFPSLSIYQGWNENVELDIAMILFMLSMFWVIDPAVLSAVDKMLKKHGLKDFQDISLDQVRKLATQFKQQNISTTTELLLKSKVYHKKYKLDMGGIPGVIRQRYIDVPTYDWKGKETNASILEEHKIGSRQYVLTLSTPNKKTGSKPAYVLKPVYNK